MNLNKTFWILLMVVLVSVILGVPKEATAATVSDSSWDNTTGTANVMNMGDTASGSITENDDLDYYQFSLPSSGCVTLDMTAYMEHYCIIIYDADGEEIWYTDSNKWTESVGFRRDNYDVYLESGHYYMQVHGGWWHDSASSSTGEYILATQYQSSNVTFDRDDNSFATANPIFWNKIYTGQISVNDAYDTFKFQVSSGRTVVIDITSYMNYYSIIIFDAMGKEIWYTDYNEWMAVSDASGYEIRYSKNRQLKNGAKLIRVKGRRKNKKTIRGLSKRKKYYIQVRAYKRSGSKTAYGKWSSKKCLRTK